MSVDGRYSFGDRFANSDLGPSWMVVEFRDGQLVAGHVTTARIFEVDVLVVEGPSHRQEKMLAFTGEEREPYPEIVRVYLRSNFYRARPCSEVTARQADRLLRMAEKYDYVDSLRLVRRFLNGLTDQINASNQYTSDEVPKEKRLRSFLPMAGRSWNRELVMVVEFQDGHMEAGDIGIYSGRNFSLLSVSTGDSQTNSVTEYSDIKRLYELDDFKRGRVCNMSQADLATRYLRESWERTGQFYHSKVFGFVAGLAFQLSPPDPPIVIDKCEVVVDESNSTPPKA